MKRLRLTIARDPYPPDPRTMDEAYDHVWTARADRHGLRDDDTGVYPPDARLRELLEGAVQGELEHVEELLAARAAVEVYGPDLDTESVHECGDLYSELEPNDAYDVRLSWPDSIMERIRDESRGPVDFQETCGEILQDAGCGAFDRISDQHGDTLLYVDRAEWAAWSGLAWDAVDCAAVVDALHKELTAWIEGDVWMVTAATLERCDMDHWHEHWSADVGGLYLAGAPGALRTAVEDYFAPEFVALLDLPDGLVRDDYEATVYEAEIDETGALRPIDNEEG